MIIVKNKVSIMKMEAAGKLLAGLFDEIGLIIKPGVSTLEIDSWIEAELKKKGLVSKTKGYMGYRHSSCVSVNNEVVHGVPAKHNKLLSGD